MGATELGKLLGAGGAGKTPGGRGCTQFVHGRVNGRMTIDLRIPTMP